MIVNIMTSDEDNVIVSIIDNGQNIPIGTMKLVPAERLKAALESDDTVGRKKEVAEEYNAASPAEYAIFIHKEKYGGHVWEPVGSIQRHITTYDLDTAENVYATCVGLHGTDGAMMMRVIHPRVDVDITVMKPANVDT